MRIFLKGCFFCVGLGFFTVLPAFGQNFEVAPVDIEFNAEPGESQKQILRVKNHAQEKQKYQLSLSDFKINEKGKKVPTAAGSTDHSIVDWITLNPSVLELKPNQEGKVEVVLNVPTGGYKTRWGVLHVKPVKEQSVGEADKEDEVRTGINIVPRISVWIKQSPESNENNKGKIKALNELDTPGDSLRKFEFEVVNTGEKILEGRVWLSLVNVKTGKERNFPKKEVEVFPGKNQEYTLTLPEKAVKKGRYALAAILEYGEKKPLEAVQIVIQ